MQKKKFNRAIRNLVADFRGLPRETSRSFSKVPNRIGNTVSVLMKKIAITRVRPERAVQENWCNIVGEKFFSRCSPIKILMNDVLVVQSDNAIIRSELQMKKNSILKKIHEIPRCAKIVDIRFIANA